MSSLPDATGKIVEVLTPFSTEERIRIVRASLMLLGDEFGVPKVQSDVQQQIASQHANGDDANSACIHTAAQQWMKKNDISREQLEQFFHFEQEQVTPIAVPGSATSRKDQTANAYITIGLAAYLANGDASFTDTEARKFCEQSGCYDSANHARSIKDLKNRVTGSKATGWKLTAPGLHLAAELVKQSMS